MISVKNYSNNSIKYGFLGSKGMNAIINHERFEKLNEEYQKIYEKYRNLGAFTEKELFV